MNTKRSNIHLSPIRQKEIQHSAPKQMKYFSSARKHSSKPKNRVIQVNQENPQSTYYNNKTSNLKSESKFLDINNSLYSGKKTPLSHRAYMSHRELIDKKISTTMSWNTKQRVKLESENDLKSTQNLSFNNTLMSIYSTCKKEKNPLKQIAKDYQTMTHRKQSQQKSHGNLPNTSTFTSSFSDRIQGASSNNKFNMGLLKQDKYFRETQSFYNFDYNVQNLDPELHQLQKEFYHDTGNKMPEGQKVQSELYLNTRFIKAHVNTQKKQQDQQFSKLNKQLQQQKKRHQEMLSHVSVPQQYQYNQDQNPLEEDYTDEKKQVTFQGVNTNNNSPTKGNKGQQGRNSVSFNPLIHDKKEVLTHVRQYIEMNDWHPQGRVGATLTETNGYIYLIGGRANDLISDVCVLKTQKHHIQENKWISLQLFQKYKYESQQPIFKNMIHHKSQNLFKKASNMLKVQSNFGFQPRQSGHSNGTINKQQQQQDTSSMASLPDQSDGFSGRFNHTACLWNGNIIVFGGEQHFDVRYKKRSVLNEVFMFNVDTLSWTQKICRGDAVEARRNHTANMLGNCMMVLGGVNSFEKVPSDLIYLDMIDMKWKIYGDSGKYENIWDRTGALSYHTACAVYEDVHKQKLHSSRYYKPHALIKEQGIYFYGGKFQNNKVNEHLYLLNTFTIPIQWKKVETIGKTPKKRYSHSMTYDQGSKHLIIMGGKTETYDIHYLDDIFILKLHNLEWLQVDLVKNCFIEPRASFAYCMEGSQFFVFGGLKEDQFFGGELNIFEFDQKRISKIKKGYDFSKKENIVEEMQANQMKKQIIDNRVSATKSFLPLPGLNYMNFSKGDRQRDSQMHTSQQALQNFEITPITYSPPPEQALN